MDRYSIQPRTSELKRKGLIRDSGSAGRMPPASWPLSGLPHDLLPPCPSRTDSARHGGALKLHRGAVSVKFQLHRSSRNTARKTADCRELARRLQLSYLTLVWQPFPLAGTGRGGARNRADRESHALTAAHIGNLKAAERHADKIGLPFTRMITIHWEAAGVPLAGMAKATGRFIDLLTKALARHGSRTAWLWVHENGGPTRAVTATCSPMCQPTHVKRSDRASKGLAAADHRPAVSGARDPQQTDRRAAGLGGRQPRSPRASICRRRLPMS